MQLASLAMNFGKYLFTSKQKKSNQYEIGLFKKVAILAVCYFHSYTVAQCVFCRVVHIIGKALIGVLWAAAAQSSALAAPSSILCTLVPLFFLLSLAVGSFFFGLKLKLAQKRASLSLHPALYSFCCWPSKRLAITTDDILLPLVSSTPRLLTSPFPLRTTKRVTLRQKRSPPSSFSCEYIRNNSEYQSL